MFLRRVTTRGIPAFALVAMIAVAGSVVVPRTAPSEPLGANQMAALLGGQPPPLCPGCRDGWNYSTCRRQDECTICQGSVAPANPGACATFGTSYSYNAVHTASFDPSDDTNTKKAPSFGNGVPTNCGYLDTSCNYPLPQADSFSACDGYYCLTSFNQSDRCRNCKAGTVMPSAPIMVIGHYCVPCGS